MAEFKQGDIVRVRTWQSMVEKHGGSVFGSTRFRDDMSHLWGKEAIVSVVTDDDIFLKPRHTEDEALDWEWLFYKEMLEPAPDRTTKMSEAIKEVLELLEEPGGINLAWVYNRLKKSLEP